jgi:muramoyltetrapeptide carboxypeptidase
MVRFELLICWILPNLNKVQNGLFGDITVLHNHLNTMGYKTIHYAHHLSQSHCWGWKSKMALGNLRYEIAWRYEFDRIRRVSRWKFINLYSLLGSTSAIDCTDKILFIEDLDEYLYHIDRMMMNLKRNGWKI